MYPGFVKETREVPYLYSTRKYNLLVSMGGGGRYFQENVSEENWYM